MVSPAPLATRQVRRWLGPPIVRAARTPGADRYRKHFPATAHLWLLVWFGLSGLTSLRQLHAVLGADRAFAVRIGLRAGLSLSQLCRSSTSRPPACLETLLAEVIALARQRVARDRTWRFLTKVHVLDSTFLGLALKLSPWSQYGGHAPGLRIQCALDLARAVPVRAWWTLADRNDQVALKTYDLADLRGWTVLCDRGYYRHRSFQRLRDAGVHFLTRLHPDAFYVITAVRRVGAKPTPEGDVLLSDETITLGSPNNRKGSVLAGLRLVTSQNRRGGVHRFVTDRFDLTAAELVRLYRRRWQIELFFRFLKHQLRAITPLGYSPRAVWLTFLVAVLTAVVLLLSDRERPAGVSRIAWARALHYVLFVQLRGS